jgi:predicted ArsR family transcriptional regulator
MSEKNLKTRISEYLAAHDNATEEEIAQALNLHIVDVLNALIEMEKEGEVSSEPVEESKG